jgi:hypothetical protein
VQLPGLWLGFSFKAILHTEEIIDAFHGKWISPSILRAGLKPSLILDTAEIAFLYTSVCTKVLSKIL